MTEGVLMNENQNENKDINPYLSLLCKFLHVVLPSMPKREIVVDNSKIVYCH